LIRAGLCLLLVAAACRSTPPYRAHVTDDAGATYAAIEGDAKKVAPEDEALWRSELASACLKVGREEEAFASLHRASLIMGTLETTTAEDARAIFGAEATSTWRGDPYERCMNALYKGMLYWRRGDLDNASACFKRGLLADAWSEVGESQQDFAALMFLLGWVSHLRGRFEQARFSFEEARKIDPENPFFQAPDPDRDNVLIVADLGPGPVKFADGPYASIARFGMYEYPEGALELSIDGTSWGASSRATDLYHQAITRGKRVIDGIRKGKAVFKAGTEIAGTYFILRGANRHKGEDVAIGVGLLLLSALTRSEADTRCWSQLPAEIHVLPARLAPGPHRLTLRVLDHEGRPLPGWTQDFNVQVPPGVSLLYYFRTGNGHEIYGLTDVPTEKTR